MKGKLSAAAASCSRRRFEGIIASFIIHDSKRSEDTRQFVGLEHFQIETPPLICRRFRPIPLVATQNAPQGPSGNCNLGGSRQEPGLRGRVEYHMSIARALGIREKQPRPTNCRLF
jgi:hypothetical protein